MQCVRDWDLKPWGNINYTIPIVLQYNQEELYWLWIWPNFSPQPISCTFDLIWCNGASIKREFMYNIYRLETSSVSVASQFLQLSSSVPSAQSRKPLHCRLPWIQLPSSHLNWSGRQDRGAAGRMEKQSCESPYRLNHAGEMTSNSVPHTQHLICLTFLQFWHLAKGSGWFLTLPFRSSKPTPMESQPTAG